MNYDLLVQEIFHGIVGLPFAFLIWKKTKSKIKTLLVLIFTYLIDIDHLVDYFLYYGTKFNLMWFLSADYFLYTKRAVVPFHAWEWLVLLGIFAYKKGWRSFFAILFFALLAHLIYDSITVGSITFYSIIYRIGKNFVNLN